jgi:hypothetical protein
VGRVSIAFVPYVDDFEDFKALEDLRVENWALELRHVPLHGERVSDVQMADHVT